MAGMRVYQKYRGDKIRFQILNVFAIEGQMLS